MNLATMKLDYFKMGVLLLMLSFIQLLDRIFLAKWSNCLLEVYSKFFWKLYKPSLGSVSKYFYMFGDGREIITEYVSEISNTCLNTQAIIKKGLLTLDMYDCILAVALYGIWLETKENDVRKTGKIRFKPYYDGTRIHVRGKFKIYRNGDIKLHCRVFVSQFIETEKTKCTWENGIIIGEEKITVDKKTTTHIIDVLLNVPREVVNDLRQNVNVENNIPSNLPSPFNFM